MFLEWTGRKRVLSCTLMMLADTENETAYWGPPNPFHQPHYLLLNLAIGGLWGGDPSNSTFPGKYEVDYVRIYQLK